MKYSIVPANFDRDTFYNGTAEQRLELANWLGTYLLKFTPGMYSYLECQAAMQAWRAVAKVKKEALKELALEAKHYNALAEQYE